MDKHKALSLLHSLKLYVAFYITRWKIPKYFAEGKHSPAAWYPSCSVHDYLLLTSYIIIPLALSTKLKFIPVFLSVACAAVYHTVFMSLVLQRLPSSPDGQKKHWEHQVLQQSGQTICILIFLRFFQSCAVNQNAKNKFREGNKSHQILSLDCLLLTRGSFVLTRLVWGCYTIPVVPVLQACFKDWKEAQMGNA